ncbi:hypothetical protein [Paenibacillus sp. JJ-100]|uniref:hypothetical protein n=1 Tax=Paenibacillus sp. JJ-100 TaxID=2974896 RepID=UPI00232D4639|nr:hypothetical protein [Paenibacillus sp. JJ-100]
MPMDSYFVLCFTSTQLSLEIGLYQLPLSYIHHRKEVIIPTDHYKSSEHVVFSTVDDIINFYSPQQTSTESNEAHTRRAQPVDPPKPTDRKAER